ncbi:MAG: HD-GYP domain-containing protein [Alkalimonas sp.]|nr:HD-GYP domain-containing protein [Alkalimonas sp.]
MLKWFQQFQPSQHGTTNAEQLSKDLLSSLMVMAWFVEAKDPYTGGHLWRVSRYANVLARAGKLPEGDVARITLGGFLHDLGKVAIPDAVLNKTGKLSDSEYRVIQTHPQAGGRMLAGHPLGHLVAAAVELHHERPDGNGYPHGLATSMIPVDAAIVGICDAFDAMTSQRPYRKPMPLDKVVSIFRQEMGSQFNQFWGELFLTLVEQGKVDNIIGHSDEGIPLHTCPHCGPTVVQHSDDQIGDHLHCRVCHSEMELCTEHDKVTVKPTGKKGNAAEMQPKADNLLIKKLIEQSIAHIPLQQLMKLPGV